MNYKDLPDTITPSDYAQWRNIGRDKAIAHFHMHGFPRIENTGNRLVADKRAVLLFDLGLRDIDKKELLFSIGKEMINN